MNRNIFTKKNFLYNLTRKICDLGLVCMKSKIFQISLCHLLYLFCPDYLPSAVCVLCWLSHFTCVQILCNSVTEACQVSLFMGFSRQEYWSGLPFPSPGDLPDPGIEPRSLMFPALAGRFFTTSTPGKPPGQVSWPPVTAVAYVFTKAALHVFCSPELPSKLLL